MVVHELSVMSRCDMAVSHVTEAPCLADRAADGAS